MKRKRFGSNILMAGAAALIVSMSAGCTATAQAGTAKPEMSVSTQVLDTQPANPQAGEAGVSSGSTSTLISEAEMKQIVLAKVPGATEQDIREWEFDRDDGRYEYEGEIIYGGYEYEFTIDASTGSVIKWKTEQWRQRGRSATVNAGVARNDTTENAAPSRESKESITGTTQEKWQGQSQPGETHRAGNSTGSTDGLVSEAAMKQAVLARVPGATEQDIREWEFDRDDGRYEYEGEIIYGGYEYEFTIDASTGHITEWKTEPWRR